MTFLAFGASDRTGVGSLPPQQPAPHRNDRLHGNHQVRLSDLKRFEQPQLVMAGASAAYKVKQFSVR